MWVLLQIGSSLPTIQVCISQAVRYSIFQEMQVGVLAFNRFSNLAVLEDEGGSEHPRDIEQPGKRKLLEIDGIPGYLQVPKHAVKISRILDLNRQHGKDDKEPQKQPISLRLPLPDESKRLLVVIMKQRKLIHIPCQLHSRFPKSLDDRFYRIRCPCCPRVEQWLW